MFFDDVQMAAPDVMYHLKVQADNDHHPNKVDLGIGIYRNEQGVYHELQALREAKEQLAALHPGHDYEVTTGNPSYLKNAAKLIFGKDSKILDSGRVASVQTISGTGALHIAAMFLARSVPGMKLKAYVGTPTWGNYAPMFKSAGIEVQTYTHYDPRTGSVDWDSILQAIRTADEGSVFILQACGHNPTAADFTEEQWRILAEEMKQHKLFPLFDIAYHGLAGGLEKDVFCIRHFADLGFEMLVAQTFAKNFGLYGERVGALHCVCSTEKAALASRDQLRFLIRIEFSSSPAYGARLVDLILSDPEREQVWKEELESLHKRLLHLRRRLFDLLTNTYKTPGDWSVILKGSGLFSILPLTQQQCEALQDDHIYLVPTTGRITVPGLNESNLDHVAKSIDKVVRNAPSARIP